LIFVDDDISVPSTFVEGHLRAQRDWPGVLGAGAIRLADSMTSTPFGRFRRRLEEKGVPVERGFVDRPNFCAAGNMSLPRSTFRELGGFDQELTDGEDQDLALRHSARGGRIAFLPDVPAIHRDEAVDFPRYLRRVEAGAERLVAFCRRHPDWPDNRERMRVNGPVRLGREPLAESAQKIAKTALGTAWAEALLLRMVGVLETRAPGSGALERLYSVLLGVRLRRGFRRGLAEVLRAERS
jgi:GT2 family glycosyltransferase